MSKKTRSLNDIETRALLMLDSESMGWLFSGDPRQLYSLSGSRGSDTYKLISRLERAGYVTKEMVGNDDIPNYHITEEGIEALTHRLMNEPHLKKIVKQSQKDH